MTGVDHEIVRGQRWRWALWLTDDDDAAVPLQGPASMDVRTGSASTTTLVVRLDTDPSATEGTIALDGLPRGGLTFDLPIALSEALVPGTRYYDVWACKASAPAEPVRLCSGKFVVKQRTTTPIATDEDEVEP